ncbi:MAG TPA: hypothetical protein VKA85_08300 [Candidatus Limnocylindrales bacterium]|nr:hypothetical protein [Candidatus Limnocylindrales bacterium]
MIRGLGKLLLLRFMPRRLIPVLTAWEVLQLVRGRRRQQQLTEPTQPGMKNVTPRTASSTRPPLRR